MSDKDKTTIRSKGSTVDDAVNEALLRLGARRDEVEITVIEEGKPGVLGVFGRKRAEVEVTRKTGGRSRGGRGRDRDRDGRDRGERGGRRER
ncbi:MAG TPA: Jag N-terminal domain-containing protein, partial [Candidatus Krumholzibacteria bacterium]|nr:Jag N-terminal domain-containing protein [Candidatus Krumholzibacteria bacterium]